MKFMVSLAIGACLIAVGGALVFGRGKLVGRVQGLSKEQHGALLAVVGVIVVVTGLLR